MGWSKGLLFTSIVVNVLALMVAWLQIPLYSSLRFVARASHEFLPGSPDHKYTVEILSVDPFMIYLNNFLTSHESQYFLKLGQSLFKPSKVYINSTVMESALTNYRTSSSCILPHEDPIVALVKQRAISMLGFIPFDGIEAIQLVRYGPSELFGMHYDWFNDPLTGQYGERYNRIASFFIYLDANCTSGGTLFPRLPAPPQGINDDRFSTTANRTGLVVMPRAGSGIAWMNLKEDKSGDKRTIHAGLPVREGTKVGMNIWVKIKL